MRERTIKEVIAAVSIWRLLYSGFYKNGKYTLGKRDAGIEDLPVKRDKDAKNFNATNLALDNWFSSISYYRVNSIVDSANCMVKGSKIYVSKKEPRR